MSKEPREYGWDGFNGTRNDWAWFTIENFDLPTAKDYDNVEREILYKELLATKKEHDELKAENEQLKEKLDTKVERLKRELSEVRQCYYEIVNAFADQVKELERLRAGPSKSEFEEKLYDQSIAYLREAYIADPEGTTFHRVNERFEDGARWAFRYITQRLNVGEVKR